MQSRPFMKTKSMSERVRAKAKGDRKGRIETAAVSGAVAGAAVGAVTGPAGVAAGAILGGAAGAITGMALANESQRRHEHDADLDKQIGVSSGDMGAADPKAPPARLGLYSAGSAGAASTGGTTPSEGPIQDIDD
jgi:phage tail tape-measure protein